MPPRYEAFWLAASRAQLAYLAPSRFYEAFAFGDDEVTAGELADLVLRGVKRATTSLLWSYEHEGRACPQPGALSIVTNWSGQPLCLIETRAVDAVPFEDVSESFARAEGEGDGTLASWRREHGAFFARQCSRMRRVPNRRMPVLCEQFEVVYRRPGLPAQRLRSPSQITAATTSSPPPTWTGAMR